MRIALYANPLLDRGVGVGVYTTELVRHLPRVAPQDEFLLFYNSFRRAGDAATTLGELSAPDNVQVVLNTGLKRAIAKAWRFDWPPIEAFTGPLDVYHGTNCFSAPARRARRVVTIHDLTPLLFPEWHNAEVRRYGPELRRTLRDQDLILAVSEATKRDMERHLAIPSERIRVVPLAAAERFVVPSKDHVERTLERHGIRRPYVLHTGTFEPRKNHVRLFEAFAQLPKDPELVLVGTKGWLNQEVFGAIRRLGLQDRVRILGYVPDDELPALYGGATMFVYPSLYEGFGLPPLEAMACGVPVLTSDVASLPEVVGDAALLVDPYSVEELAEGMRRLWDDGALRSDLSRRGLERARGFSWERTARETHQAYREAVDG